MLVEGIALGLACIIYANIYTAIDDVEMEKEKNK